MITKDELRRIVILGYLTDSMLEKLIPIVARRNIDDQEIIFRQGDSAEKFFMLGHGKILLEHRISDKMTVSIDAVRPGYSFGWSGLMTGGIEPYSRYTSDAIAAEPSELFVLKGDDLNNLLEADEHMGFLFYRRLNLVIARRLRHRTEQFVRVIKQHPDIDNLIID